MKGMKNVEGQVIPGTLLIGTLRSCTDFKDEITRMQIVAEKLGIIIMTTPKCHPEIAGEGVEYSLAFAKGFYRRFNINDKKTYQSFKASVIKAKSREQSPQILEESTALHDYVPLFGTTKTTTK